LINGLPLQKLWQKTWNTCWSVCTSSLNTI